ncbi:MAG: hypothetical protein AB4038_18975 [Prochloraceae cyanobacterium]
MLTQFRIRYPQGSLISELVRIDRSKYVVRVLVQVDGVTLATGLAAAETVEKAEDSARDRALATLALEAIATTQPGISKTNSNQMPSSSVSASLPTKLGSEVLSQRTDPQKLGHGDAEIKKSPAEEKITSMSDYKSEVPESFKPQEQQKKIANSSAKKETPAESDVLPEKLEPTDQSQDLLADNLAKDFSLPPQQQASTDRETLILDEPFVLSSPETVLEQPRTSLSSDYDTSEPSPPENQLSYSTGTTIEFSDIIAQTNVEMKRLRWTNEQGRDYLLQTYGKRSRQLLSDEELLEFLDFLKKQPIT